MNTLWSMKYGIAAVLLLLFGWFAFNIWPVMAGTLLAIVSVRTVTMAMVPKSVRAITCGATLGILVALTLAYPSNHDLALAAAVYALVLLFQPWVIYKAPQDS